MLSEDELEARFGAGRKPPWGTPSKNPVHQNFRDIVKKFAGEVDAWLPEGRYKSLALTDLESFATWAHKSIQNDL